MTSRDRVIRALNHQSVDRAPRDIWLLPGMEADHADDVAEMNLRFPSDIVHLDTKSPVGKRTKGAPNRSGHYTDAWGCTWQLGHRGAAGPLVDLPLADAAKIASYEPPTELLETARFSRVNRSCEGTSRFMLAWSEARPLDRIQFLRGPEAAVSELVSGNKELRALLVKLQEFSRREIELWALTEVDGLVFGDDLGSPSGPRISPKTWRNLIKPLYREYCEILHAHDKFAFFHGEGHISDVFADLVEVGIDAIHSQQLYQTDFEKLSERFRGQITFWGEIDRKWTEPSGHGSQVHEAVLRVRRALDFGAGGVVAQCAWSPGVPIRSIAAFFEEWMIPLPVNV